MTGLNRATGQLVELRPIRERMTGTLIDFGCRAIPITYNGQSGYWQLEFSCGCWTIHRPTGHMTCWHYCATHQGQP